MEDRKRTLAILAVAMWAEGLTYWWAADEGPFLRLQDARGVWSRHDVVTLADAVQWACLQVSSAKSLRDAGKRGWYVQIGKYRRVAYRVSCAAMLGNKVSP